MSHSSGKCCADVLSPRWSYSMNPICYKLAINLNVLKCPVKKNSVIHLMKTAKQNSLVFTGGQKTKLGYPKRGGGG